MGLSVSVSGEQGLEQYRRLLNTLGDPKHKAELLDSLGAVVESQTRRRIADEKTAPDGSSWEAWSPGYAATRHGNQSLLQGLGDLLDSIQYQVERNQVRIGSPLAYARALQEGFDGTVTIPAHVRRITQAFGKTLSYPVYQSVSSFTRAMNMPAREFLGLSRDNQTEVYSVLGAFWQGLGA